MITKVLSAVNLADVHTHRHGHANIATYIRGRCRVDYCFASPRILEHVLRCGFEYSMLENCVITVDTLSICLWSDCLTEDYLPLSIQRKDAYAVIIQD